MIPETGSPTSSPSCPHCGGPIPSDAPGGLCPRCLLLGAARPTEPAGLGGNAPEPSLDEIRAAFPALEVVERLGAGGMGVVFKARQPALDRWVALKVLPRHLAADPAFAERFQREARLLARLSHPGIVAVHEFGQAGPFCYLLLEYVDGLTLRQAMRAGRMSPAEALALVPRICEALQYAHDHGVLHRDIKPENILLDAAGRVKITDFGIAKLVGDPRGDITLTENGARLGTPHYMAPEQVEDPARVDHRADIYSLGVVFYELLTGELPLGRFAAPSAKSALDARIDEIVLRALTKERELRQQSAGEVKTQVEHVARHPGPPTLPATPAPEAPAPMSVGHLNWAAGLVVVSLLLAVPPVLVLGYVGTGLTGGAGLATAEWLFIALTLLPALVLGIVGTFLAEREVPAFRQGPAAAPGRRRLMFALGIWPTLVAQFCAGVLTAGLLLLLTGAIGRTSMVAAAAGAIGAVAVVGIVMAHLMARQLRSPGNATRPVRVPGFQWLLQGGLALLFLFTFSGFLLRMVERDRELRQRIAQQPPPNLPPLGNVSPRPEPASAPDQPAQLPPSEAVLRPTGPTDSGAPSTAVLHLPAGRLARLTARLWSNGVALPGGVMPIEIPGLPDQPTDVPIGWTNRTEGPARDPDPSWAILVQDSRGYSLNRPAWFEGQPTRWEIHPLGGWLGVVQDPEPAVPSTPVLTGTAPGPHGPVPWQVTLEATWLPAPRDGLTAEMSQLNFVREQLWNVRQRAANGEIPARGREILDAEGREAVARAIAERNPAAGARAIVVHARAILALTEEEHRAGRATQEDLDRARAALEAAVTAAGPAAQDVP